MRRTFTILFLLVVLALPVAQAGAAAKTTKRVVTKKFTGVAYQADRWGDLQVRITVRKTTHVGKKVTRQDDRRRASRSIRTTPIGPSTSTSKRSRF